MDPTFEDLGTLARKIDMHKADNETAVDYLEREMAMSDVFPLRRSMQILECGEPLKAISTSLFTFELPHPYQSAGSPYGDASPFFLREGVVKRLEQAAATLNSINSEYKLHIFDGYRPLDVQRYMRDHEFKKHAADKNWDAGNLSPDQIAELWRLVDLVWAHPSTDVKMPPPHATGAAVDLTISKRGQLLEMGSAFDEPSDRILPNYYRTHTGFDAAEIKENRQLLNQIMRQAGFERNSHEWWHFSYGDQLAAMFKFLNTGVKEHAIYGFAKQES